MSSSPEAKAPATTARRGAARPVSAARPLSASPQRSAKPESSLRCTNCGVPTESLFRNASGVRFVAACPACGRPLDPYVEHDEVHTSIDVMLLKGAAWRHYVFNADASATWPAIVGALGAVLVDVFIVCLLLGPLRDPATTFVPMAAGKATTAQPTLTGAVSALVQPLPSLRLVNFARSNTLLWQPSAVIAALRLLPGAATETVLSLLALVWVASALAPAGRVPQTKCSVVAWATVQLVRLGAGVFFVWEAPLYFMLLLDITGAMWTFKALGTLTGARSFARLIGTAFCFGVTRAVVRTMTGWAPVLPWLAIMSAP